MSSADYEKAVSLMSRRPELQDFAGPRTEETVEQAEKALGYQLPATYRRFVSEFGAGSFGSIEIYGVISNRRASSVPDGIWYTLDERQRSGLERELLVIGNDGHGNLICLDRRVDESNPPVVRVEPGRADRRMDTLAPDFGAFLLEEVNSQI
jgi:hypothetical protein